MIADASRRRRVDPSQGWPTPVIATCGPTWFPCLSPLLMEPGARCSKGSIPSTRKFGAQRKKALPRQNLDLTIEARLHLEVAVVDLAFTAGDGDVVALLEHDPWKCTDRLLDDVAPRGENRPRGIGKGLAALLADQLEGNDGGAVMDRHVGQLAGLNGNVGAHHCIAVAIDGVDVIDTLR